MSDPPGGLEPRTQTQAEFEVNHLTHRGDRRILGGSGDFYLVLIIEPRANFYENPRQTSFDKTSHAVVKSEPNALVEVSDPP